MGYSNEIIISTYPPPPFDWMQIGILAILGVAAVLVFVGVATTKN